MLSTTISQMDTMSNKRQRIAPMNPFEMTAPATNTGTVPGSPQRNSTANIQSTQQLDSRQNQHQRQQQVGMTTNPGQFLQHYLQVAQPKDSVRPGQSFEIPSKERISEEEYRRRQHSILERQLDMQLGRYSPQMPQHFDEELKMERSRSSPESFNVQNTENTPAFQGGWISINGQMVFVPAQQPRLVPRRPSSSHGPSMSGSMSGNMSMLSHPANAPMPINRPFTPPNQNCSSTPPMTPEQTPANHVHQKGGRLRSGNVASTSVQSHNFNQSAVQVTNEDAMDLSTTIKAPKQNSTSRSLFDDMFQEPASDHGGHGLPSPPQTISLRSARKFDVAKMPNSPGMDGLSKLVCNNHNGKPTLDAIQCSPLMLDNVDSLISIPSSPQTTHGRNNSISYSEQSYHTGYGSGSQNEGQSPMEFTTPFGSPSKQDLGIADLNLEAAFNDTGISSEEVNQYISAQDSETMKYTCMFEGCGRVFGRKENIRSHVQTHLGDRQFKCPHCNKDFVRQHDLKRHAKIHSGVKPYPCACGNSFARHDALTRHRQRGICCGSFAGIVKKNAKRGRPRKNRPDGERADKAYRTRKRVAEQAYNSSASTTSDSSYMYSPEFTMVDNFSSTENTQQTDVSMSNNNSEGQFFDPQVFNSYTPPHSPYTIDPLGSPKKITPAPTSAPSPPAEDSDEVALMRALNEYEPAHSPSQYSASNSRDASQAGSPPGLSLSSRPSSSHGIEQEQASKSNRSNNNRTSPSFQIDATQANTNSPDDQPSILSGIPAIDEIPSSYFDAMMDDELFDLGQSQFDKSSMQFPNPTFDDHELFE